MRNRNETKAGERVYICTKGPHPANPVGTCNWMYALDDFKYISWLQFVRRKIEMVKFVSHLIGKL